METGEGSCGSHKGEERYIPNLEPTTPNTSERREHHVAAQPGQLPEVGQPMPDFSLAGTDGATHTLGDLTRDRRGLVLFFFPKANTSG